LTKTEKFRKLLDELGVKWTEPTYEYWELLGGIPTSHYVTIVDGKSVEEAIDGTLTAHHLTPEQAVAATVGAQEVYLLMGTDTYDGREYVLGVFSTEEEAEAAIGDNRYGYGLHNVQRWEVDA
jgi:hypothetical protein